MKDVKLFQVNTVENWSIEDLYLYIQELKSNSKLLNGGCQKVVILVELHSLKRDLFA